MEDFLAVKRRPECKKGHWSPDEDKLLVELVISDGPGNWSKIAKKIKGRRGSSCRTRWVNHLNPQVVKTPFSKEEKERLLQLYKDHGSKWSSFVGFFRGRTDSQLKNLYHSLVATRRRAKAPIPSYSRNWAAPPNIGGSVDLSGSGVTNVSQFSDVAWWGKKADLPLFNGGDGSSSIYAGGSSLFGAHHFIPGINGFYSFENTNLGNVYANLGKNHGDPMMSSARSAVAQAQGGGASMKNNQFIDFLGAGGFQNN